MTDRELLELAAKAAGYGELRVLDDSSIIVHCRRWNPLADDGDALRLAVDLGLLVGAHDDESWAQWYIKPDGGWITIKEARGEYPYAATRRAIVRCAAEIGKGMP